MSTEKWVAPALRLTPLEHLESDCVSIQCINSSDFVVGKQTNFNGPVTIINCVDAMKRGGGEGKCEKRNEENFVIKKKILSRPAAMKMQKMALEKENAKGGRLNQEKPKKRIFKISAFVFAGLLVTAVVGLCLFPTSAQKEPPLKCIPLQVNSCIYFGFEWGGRPISKQIKPLETPASYVVVFQTHEDYCYDVDACLKVVQFFQRNGTDETACNFLLGGDGNVYEDRGWHWENSLSPPVGGKALKICFVGNFTEEDYPTYPQLLAAKALILAGVHDNYVSKDYVLTASNATAPRDSLASIYKIIKKWANFRENPFSKR